MRQRNIKNLDERIANNSRCLIENPAECKGRWSLVFGNDNPIYLEIGCGKGQFIVSRAARYSDRNFIAVEGQGNVIIRALEKAESSQLENLRIFKDFVHDLEDYFNEGELSGIYLNFSDPWPKARHAKRRLTFRRRLENYKKVLCNDGFVEFKTDNDQLFDFTLEEIGAAGYKIKEITRNLHEEKCVFESKEFTTEYEDKFSGKGKNINYVKF